jgi:hypothetical protein
MMPNTWLTRNGQQSGSAYFRNCSWGNANLLAFFVNDSATAQRGSIIPKGFLQTIEDYETSTRGLIAED